MITIWCRQVGDDPFVQIERIIDYKNELAVQSMGFQSILSLDHPFFVDCEWSDLPIPEPDEVQ